jgi:ribosomal protein S8
MLSGGYCSAQELVVKSVTMQPGDRSAIEKPVLDANNDTCALVKIKVDNLKDLHFTNKEQYVGDVKYENGEYLLYKSINIGRMISYQHQDYVPGVIDLADYGYRRLKSGKTYIVTMEAPVIGIGKSIVALKVMPATANVTFNNTEAKVSTTGIYEFPVSAGTYTYVVQAPNYMQKSGSITIQQDASKTLTIRLSPITHQVDIKCNISNAHIFVDNIDYGKVGKHELPQGSHVVRIQAEGYIDAEEPIDINENTRQLSFQLKKNENRIDIHATSVTIISSSKRIYKNNKELKEWKSGEPIKFMPGKYMISNDYGNEKIITVGSEPMTVSF